MKFKRSNSFVATWVIALASCIAMPNAGFGAEIEDAGRAIVQNAQAERVAMIDRVSPTVVSVFDEKERGGGSGVIIDAEGYGLTNFHVVAPMLESRRGWGGLSDGKMYELQVLGIDPTGDLAMFRLAGDKPFAYAALGDSDKLALGDTAIAMGNPFSLSDDYTPTVTMGIVTGLHRYQWGTGGNLSYTDCIQVDASINPGNSGGPLFNAAGEVIGINGRISVNTRGRFNVGFGYAISSNQIKRFVPALRAGLLARHGTLPPISEANVEGVTFARIALESRAYKEGLRPGDKLIGFDEMPIVNRNQYASVLGAYPANWPVVLDVARGDEKKQLTIRLDPINPKMDKGFAFLAEQNQDEVRHMLSAFRDSAGGKTPRTWQWTIQREYDRDPNGDCRPAERYAASLETSKAGRLVKLDDRDRPVLQIHFDAQEARQSLSSGPDGDAGLGLDLGLSERLTLAALFQMHAMLQGSTAKLNDAPKVMHVGGDALVPIDRLGDERPSALQPRTAPMFRPVLSVIEQALSDTATASLGFDALNGRLRQIRVRDVPTGEEVLIQLSEHRDIGGITWPTAITIRTRGGGYQDAYTDWKLEF